MLKRTLFIIFMIFIYFCCALFILFLIADNYQKIVKVNNTNLIFKIDASFSLQEIIEIKSSLQKWQEASNNCITFNSYVDEIKIKELFSWQNDIVPTIYNAKNKLWWKYHLAKYLCSFNGGNCIGITMIPTGDIFILKSGKLFRTIALHEIGHILLGGFHSINENDLMYPIIAKPIDLNNKYNSLLEYLYCKKSINQENISKYK